MRVNTLIGHYNAFIPFKKRLHTAFVMPSKAFGTFGGFLFEVYLVLVLQLVCYVCVTIWLFVWYLSGNSLGTCVGTVSELVWYFFCTCSELFRDLSETCSGLFRD